MAVSDELKALFDPVNIARDLLDEMRCDHSEVVIEVSSDPERHPGLAFSNAFQWLPAELRLRVIKARREISEILHPLAERKTCRLCVGKWRRRRQGEEPVTYTKLKAQVGDLKTRLEKLERKKLPSTFDGPRWRS